MKITKGTRVAYRQDPHTEAPVIDYKSNAPEFPIVTHGPDGPEMHTAKGKWFVDDCGNSEDHPLDLVPYIPKPENVRGWVSVMPNGSFTGSYKSEEMAARVAPSKAIRQAYMVEQDPPEDEA